MRGLWSKGHKARLTHSNDKAVKEEGVDVVEGAIVAGKGPTAVDQEHAEVNNLVVVHLVERSRPEEPLYCSDATTTSNMSDVCTLAGRGVKLCIAFGVSSVKTRQS